MPKKRTRQVIQCPHFRWVLYQHKNGIWYADGRSNSPDLGRHSLGTSDQAEARSRVSELDLNKAVKQGLVDKSLLDRDSKALLQIAAGRRLYEEYTRRPLSVGGPRESTRKRYRAVLDKFVPFCTNQKIQYWNQVTDELLDRYASWLEIREYAHATQCFEIATILQINKYLVEKSHLPPEALIKKSVPKIQESTTYCWKPEEVKALFKACEDPELIWLRNVLITLAYTGMRISELAGLRWNDIDFEANKISLTDESKKKSLKGRNKRTIKSGYSRRFPIHPDLQPILNSIERQDDGLVFHGSRGGKIKPDVVRTVLIRDLLKPLADRFPSPDGEVGFIDGRLHSFRHYFCSVCANNNIPERILMDWLGHKDSKMISRYYHLNEKTSTEQMSKIQIV
ncbi:tyrosine-type recombinase/integrase [Rubinisphaera italica]|uniref:Site-specific tyrosine recombinase XerC n=1 Tax=Rubinisphaera italica TaxID=2527969 RepID=A0A5C5XBB9_9PLAN|nr:site-specific integrase [Rubinisphaera italica]TWT59701.1 site-specific tyrosine recombinase XerC [Rubinisphaera italica]